MRHLLLTLKWALLTIVLAPIALYLILLLINIRDAAPSEQSLRYLAQIAQIDSSLAKNHNDNAYIFALGFSSAKDKSPITVGLQSLHNLQNKDVSSVDKTQQYALPNLPLENCIAEDNFVAACSANLRKNTHLTTLLSNNRWRINRYQQLLKMSSWHDSPSFNADISAMPFKELLLAQKLYLLDVYQNIDSTSAQFIADAIEQDMLFWQRLSLNTHILLNKMVSASAISVNMKLGEVILGQQRVEQGSQVLPISWTKPLTANVLSLDKAKLGEWRYFTKLTNTTLVDDSAIDTMTKVVTSLLHPFMQNQDTANRYAAILTNSGIQTDCDTGLSIDGITSYIYNPLGKYILCTGMPSFNAYQMTLDKLEQQRENLITRLKH